MNPQDEILNTYFQSLYKQCEDNNIPTPFERRLEEIENPLGLTAPYKCKGIFEENKDERT